MRAISLRTKFLAIIIGLILLLGLSVIILVSSKLSEKLSTELNKRGLFMAKSITEACVAPLLNDNIFKLQMALNGFERSGEDIEYVFVLDKKGRVLAHTFGERFPIDLKEVNPVSPEQPYNIQPLITEKGRMIDFAVPILNGEMGVVHLGISEEPIRKSVAKAIMLILGAITAVLVLGCSVAFMITKVITKPISDLVRGTEIVSRGNLEYKVPVSTKDEIGCLALTFNKMTEKLFKTTVSRDELAKEITDRKRAEEALKQSEEHYRAVANSAIDSIITTDNAGIIIGWNQGAEHTFGFNETEILGQSLGILIPESYREAHTVGLNRLQKGGEPRVIGRTVELEGKRKNGSEFPLELSLAQWETTEGRFFTGIIRDITERKQVEGVLKDSEERYRTAIEHSNDGVAIVREDFHLYVNQKYLEMFGYNHREEIIGKPLSLMVHPDDRDRVMEINLKRQKGEDVPSKYEVKGIRKNGDIIYIEVSATKTTYRGEVVSLAYLRDVTERKQATTELVNLNKQLEAAKEAAEAASRAKSEFLASMSHEIRTPLNAVIGMLGLLSTSELNGPHRREYVEIARSSADGLLFIINDILDFSKIEAGKLLFEPVPFDLLSVVEETIDMMVMKTREKGLDLTVQYGPDVPRHFIGDSGRIRQVLINLVNNAIKFTHKGHVLIEVRAEEQMNEEVLLRITVEDTGIGISSDTLDSLFKPFVQADASTTRRYGGTGLGLAISKRLVETMGGTIGASSRSGEGSAFWFTLCLPLDKQFTGVAVPMAEKIALHPPAESGATQTALSKTARWDRSLRVLVVEDNVVNQRVTLLMLTELGCHVDLAANGREAIEMIELLPFDMVFMDCEMPEMDGFEATREIRRLQSDRHLPIIAMTAYALQGDRERCLAAGMDDYFSKPVTLEDFQAALERWGPKDSRSFEERLKPPASLEKAPLTVENETSSVIDPNVIARLRGLADTTDSSLLTRIFHLFLSDTPKRITTLREAAATGDTAGLSKAAHSLRGACASIGVMGMAEICKTIERLGHGKYVDGAMALVEKLETEFNQVKVEIEKQKAIGDRQ